MCIKGIQADIKTMPNKRNIIKHKIKQTALHSNLRQNHINKQQSIKDIRDHC